MSRSVLIIADDERFTKKLSPALSARGATVEIEPDPRAAIPRVEGGEFETVVLDTDLQEMSGYAVSNMLKKSAGARDIPLMLVSDTADDTVFAQHSRLQTRADGYAMKNMEPDRLAQQIVELERAAVPERPPMRAPGRAFLVIIGVIVALVIAARMLAG